MIDAAIVFLIGFLVVRYICPVTANPGVSH